MTRPSGLDGRIERLKGGDEGCFGCGAENPIGLGLDDFAPTDDGKVVATFRPRPDHRGFDGVLHGGIVATALDETLAWTAMLHEGVPVLTAKLELKYRRPAPMDEVLSLEGTLLERRGSRLVMSARMTSSEGVVAEAHGLFLVASDTTAGTGA